MLMLGQNRRFARRQLRTLGKIELTADIMSPVKDHRKLSSDDSSSIESVFDEDNVCEELICGGSANPEAETTVGFRYDGPDFEGNPFGPPVTDTLLSGADCLEWGLELAENNGLEDNEVFIAYAQADATFNGTRVNDASLCAVATGCPGGLIDVSQRFPGNPDQAFTLVPETQFGEDPICSEIADSVFPPSGTRK